MNLGEYYWTGWRRLNKHWTHTKRSRCPTRRLNNNWPNRRCSKHHEKFACMLYVWKCVCSSFVLYEGVPETAEIKEAHVWGHTEERSQPSRKSSKQPRQTASGEPPGWTEGHVGHSQLQGCGAVWSCSTVGSVWAQLHFGNVTVFCICFPSCRQHKLEEALLFSGRFTDALLALNDWLYRAEPQLSDDVPVSGDKDMVNNLIDKHKVRSYLYFCISFSSVLSCRLRALAQHTFSLLGIPKRVGEESRVH